MRLILSCNNSQIIRKKCIKTIHKIFIKGNTNNSKELINPNQYLAWFGGILSDSIVLHSNRLGICVFWRSFPHSDRFQAKTLVCKSTACLYMCHLTLEKIFLSDKIIKGCIKRHTNALISLYVRQSVSKIRNQGIPMDQDSLVNSDNFQNISYYMPNSMATFDKHLNPHAVVWSGFYYPTYMGERGERFKA